MFWTGLSFVSALLAVLCCAVTAESRKCGNASNGDVRLVGGATELEGRVELCLDREWGTICDHFWSNLDATVVCEQLSYSRTDAVAIQGAWFGAGNGSIHMTDVFCDGSEDRLTDCAHRDAASTECTHNQDASVICTGTLCCCCCCCCCLLGVSPPAGMMCVDGDVRLAGGRFPSEGRVEICIDQNFGTVCDDGWDTPDAQVVCRQLGFSNGEGMETHQSCLL